MPLSDRLGAFLWSLYKAKKITKAEYKKGMAEAADTTDTPAITKLLKKKKDKLKADENKGEPYGESKLKKERRLKKEKAAKEKAAGKVKKESIAPQQKPAPRGGNQFGPSTERSWIQKMKDLDKE